MAAQAMIKEEVEYMAIEMLEGLKEADWETVTEEDLEYIFEHIFSLVQVVGREQDAEEIVRQLEVFDDGTAEFESINKYGSTEQKLVEKVLTELLNLMITQEESGGFGAKEEEEEEYIDYYRMGYKFYCSNDGQDYAAMMGGIVCPEGKDKVPACPDGNPCECIDSDGSCEDGNDDWGYMPKEDEPETPSDQGGSATDPTQNPSSTDQGGSDMPKQDEGGSATDPPRDPTANGRRLAATKKIEFINWV